MPFTTTVSQTVFLNKASSDRRYACLSLLQRVRRRVDRVVAEDEIVFVRDSRTENEFDIAQSLELYCFARRFESREVPMQ